MTHPHDPYREPTGLEDAVDRLNDPLNDPLPGGEPERQPGRRHSSPWFRPHQPSPQRRSGGYAPNADPHAEPDGHGRQSAYDGTGYDDGYDGRGAHGGAYHESYGDPLTDPPADPFPRPRAERPPQRGQSSGHGYQTPPAGRTTSGTGQLGAQPAEDSETVALRQAEQTGTVDDETVALRQAEKPKPENRPGGRRADRLARRRGGRESSRESKGAAEPESGEESGEDGEKGSVGGRVARRKAAAKERRTNASAFASRAIGEVFITTGVLLLLFVAYQLWWTNVQANQQARNEANNLERAFEDGEGKKPEAFEPGEGFAIMYIPKLDVRVPIAEGIEKDGVLDRGMVGHYDEKSGLETAMPWNEEGNFAVAGHRNTHGEPFRYVNRLKKGDEIIVETSSTYYTYQVTSWLPATSPSNIDVVSPVPKQSGFKEPGRYVTLTTCTPEFSSKYRLIVWGTMVEERPRSEGKPDALG